MAKISEFFTEAETTVTQHRGIDNRYDDKIRVAVLRTAKEMDRVRMLLNAPVIVSSWYRCLKLNKLVGGAYNSQHMRGEAVDFICPQFGSPRDVVEMLKGADVPYDQMIMEGTWVHISFRDNPRKQVLYR